MRFFIILLYHKHDMRRGEKYCAQNTCLRDII